MENYLLGLNNSKNEVRCALFNTDGRMMASSIRALSSPAEDGKTAQRDPEEVWLANIEVLKEVLELSKADPEKILCIGITAGGSGMVLVDEKLEPVCPMILSSDTRAKELCLELRKDMTERKLYPLTRSDLRPSQPSMLLKWFSIHEPEVLDKTRWILSTKDYIRYRLTDEIYGELTEASSSGLLNLSNGRYDPYIFDTLKISSCFEKMPEILDSISIAGKISEKAASLTGLKQGTPVTAGYFDLDAEALASGILSDEELCMIADTWSINEFLVGSISDNYDRMTNPATLSYIKGLYLMEGPTPSDISTLNLCIRKIMERYAPDIDCDDLNKKCDTLVARRDPQRSSVIFVPYSHAEKREDEAQGVFFNLSEEDDYVSLLRAVYEGVVFSTIHHIRNLKRPTYTYTAAKLSGSITDSTIWPQILADTLQLPIQTVRGSYIGSKGAAIGAGIACGIFKDLQEGIARMVRTGKTYIPRGRYMPIYQKKYEAYESALLNMFTSDEERLVI